jgi:hypothetical protein
VNRRELHYYSCSRCKRQMCRSTKADTWQRCDLCHCQMVHQWSVPVETPAQEALHARGVVYNPHPERAITWTCVRCEERFRYTESIPTYRVDGRCCRPCVKAEAPAPLLTPDEQAARQARKAAARREMEESQERAYQQQEQNR